MINFSICVVFYQLITLFMLVSGNSKIHKWELHSNSNYIQFSHPENKRVVFHLSHQFPCLCKTQAHKKDCLLMSKSVRDLKYEHTSCDEYHPFICSDSNNNFQIYAEENRTWIDAVKTCESRNLYLAQMNIASIDFANDGMYWTNCSVSECGDVPAPNYITCLCDEQTRENDCSLINKNGMDVKYQFRPCGEYHPFICSDSNNNFQIYAEENMTWTDAVKTCESRNQHIGRVNISIIHFANDGMFWTNFSVSDCSSDFPALYNSAGLCVKQSRENGCRMINKYGVDLEYQIRPCSEHHPFICSDSNNNFQIYAEENMTWTDAVKTCESRNLYLAQMNVSSISFANDGMFWTNCSVSDYGDPPAPYNMTCFFDEQTSTGESHLINENGLEVKYQLRSCDESHPFICYDNKNNFQIYAEEKRTWADAVKTCESRNLHLACENISTIHHSSNGMFWIKCSERGDLSPSCNLSCLCDTEERQDGCWLMNTYGVDARYEVRACNEYHPYICSDNYNNFQIYVEGNKTWIDAVETCETHNLHLAHVNVSTFTNNSNGMFWIGHSDMKCDDIPNSDSNTCLCNMHRRENGCQVVNITGAGVK